MKKYLKLMRVHHYIKNLLVFATLACGGMFFDTHRLYKCIAAFFAFCMVSSVVYIINDIRDEEKDRKHPTKCKRPIASGAVSVSSACWLAGGLALVAVVCNGLVFDPVATVLLVLYLVMNLAYSMGLKNIPIVDVSILSAGFLIRILYGAVVSDISVSNWLYLTVITFSLYFSLGKRRNELKQVGDGQTRKVLQLYSPNFLDKNMSMCLTLGNAFYALWTMDKSTISFYSSNYLTFTVPIVLLITMKYSLNVEGDSDGDPVEVLLHDKMLLALCVVYLLAMLFILYL